MPKRSKKFSPDAKTMMPSRALKQSISIRIDPDTLAWLRARGRLWQTEVNNVMRAYMQACIQSNSVDNQ